jgi:hypothetical protein
VKNGEMKHKLVIWHFMLYLSKVLPSPGGINPRDRKPPIKSSDVALVLKG